MHNRGENFSLKNFYLFKLLLCTLKALCKLQLLHKRQVIVACGRETPSAEFAKQIPWNKFAMRIFPRHFVTAQRIRRILWRNRRFLHPRGGSLWLCANFGHRYALLSEEGGSEADGWCLGFCTIACGREIPSNHRTNCNRCDSCCRLRAGTPSVSFADSSLHLREPRICANLKVIKKPSNIYIICSIS